MGLHEQDLSLYTEQVTTESPSPSPFLPQAGDQRPVPYIRTVIGKEFWTQRLTGRADSQSGTKTRELGESLHNEISFSALFPALPQNASHQLGFPASTRQGGYSFLGN